MLTAERLREVVTYDPETGEFRWKARPRVKAGKLAGHVATHGRIYLRVDGEPYSASRLAWLYMSGAWPEAEVDHRDCNPLNNRWSNLRKATRSQNLRNRRPFAQSGFKGVYLNRRCGGYAVEINTPNGRQYLGRFQDPKAGAEAYRIAAEKLADEFVRTTA